MRIRLGNEFWLLNLLVIALVVSIILAPSEVLRIVIGLPFVLFFPGYVLMAALFPRREGLGGIERVALSFVMSIAVVPLIGFILNYTWWGITMESVLYSVAAFILAVFLNYNSKLSQGKQYFRSLLSINHLTTLKTV